MEKHNREYLRIKREREKIRSAMLDVLYCQTLPAEQRIRAAEIIMKLNGLDGKEE